MHHDLLMQATLHGCLSNFPPENRSFQSKLTHMKNGGDDNSVFKRKRKALILKENLGRKPVFSL
jgi:hypothetical protein